VYLNHALVADCEAISDGSEARGGGIFAKEATTLVLSAVSGNHAYGYSRGWGGGILARSLEVKYSTLSNNYARGITAGSVGGAALSWYYLGLRNSTIDSNHADYGGALFVLSPQYHSYNRIRIENSTISGNDANEAPALLSFGTFGTYIENSTIAFNHAALNTSQGSVVVQTGPVQLDSSIVAKNTQGSGGAPSDLYCANSPSGAQNLIIASNYAPAGFITVMSDPNLGPLALNGGRTRTHALLHGSPAIASGINNNALSFDQRGTGYPRTTGAGESVDIGSFQFDSIFWDPFDSN
jgi:hypothetical protein